MPPKRARKVAVELSQEEKLETAIEKFALELSNAGKTVGFIPVPSAVLATINNVLKGCRAVGKLINQECVDEFVCLLEDDDGNNLCQRLEPEAFCTALQVILQMEPSKHAERGIYLLAASLFHDSQDLESEDINKKKDVIGTNCLLQLLNFFLDSENDFGMRRWAGLLCIQLVTGCESNHSKLEDLPDDSRRGIGRQIVEETDEILRVICAQLVRVMIDEDTPLNILFPEHYEETVYTGFPSSSQANAGWGIKFQHYLDDLPKNKMDIPAQIGFLFFAANIQLKPGHQLGAKHHNTVLYVDGTQLTFLSTSRDGYFDTILDIPVSSIKHLTFSKGNTSQVHSQRVMLDILEDNDKTNERVCYLDSKAVSLSMVAFSIDSKCIDSFEATIHDCQGGIETVGSERSEYDGGSENSPRIKKVVSLDLGDSQARTQKTSQAYLGEANETYGPRESQQESGYSKNPSPHQVPMSEGDLDTSQSSVDQVAMEHLQEEENPYDATPKNTLAKVATPEAEPVEPKPKLKSVTVRGRKPVKPKAKTPIVPGRNSLDSQLTMAKSKAHAANFNPATDDNGLTRKKNGKQAGAGSKKLPASTTVASAAKNSAKKDAKTKAISTTAPAAKKSANATSQTKAKAAKKSGESGTVSSKTMAAAQATDPAYNFSDDIITSPDLNDASTPKKPKAKTGNKTKTATKPIGNQSVSAVAEAGGSTVQPTKRYNLPKAKDSTSNAKDNDQTRSSKITALRESAKGKLKAKAESPQSKTPKPETSSQANVKKRRSPPATLPATRKSQRAAASKANDKMQGADDSHDEVGVEDMYSTMSRSNVAKGKKTDEIQKHKKPESPSVPEDQALADLQAEDARTLGLAADESPVIEQGDDEDLYGASPRPRAKKLDPVPSLPKKLATLSVGDGKHARNSGIDLANKLIDSLGGLDSDSEQLDGPQIPITKKSFITKGKTNVREPRKNEEITGQDQSPSKDNEDPLSMGTNENSVSSPIRPAPGDVTTPGTERSVLEESSRAVSSPPAAHETIETQLETQITTSIVQIVPKPSVLAHASLNGLNAASSSGDSVAVKQATLTEVGQVNAVDVSKKRKAVPETLAVRKRRRADQEEMQKFEEQILEVVQAKVTTITTEVSRKPKSKSPSPVRRSPRLATKSTQPAIELKKGVPEVSSVTKDLARKPQVIKFTGDGPQNQGVASAARLKSVRELMEIHEASSPAAMHATDRKRKRDMSDFLETVSPPMKKLNSSPMGVQEDGPTKIQPGSSHHEHIAKPKQDRQRLVSRPSSQASRVDRNGSPLAVEGQVDHFSKLKEKLASQGQNKPQELRTVPDTLAEVCEEPSTRPRRPSEIFGPKISLGKKLKGRPSSPEESNSRYIAHGESHGVYTDVDTQKVIEEKKVLPDPFVERSRKSSNFIERLQSSSSKENIAAKSKSKSRLDSRELRPAQGLHTVMSRSKTEDNLPELPREKRALNRGQQRLELMAQPARAKKPLYEISSPSEMTSGTSFRSQSSDAARTPLEEVPGPNETWNLAVRPHYKTLGQAVHRIADELMIRLSSEEDRMDLLVSQYKENGTKILNSMTKQREIERGAMSRSFDRKKAGIATIYGESRTMMMETEESMREDSTSRFEADWRKTQSVISKKIAEGWNSSEI
ncbi:hypothetical protein BKA61DRAFT_579227 [Leptodontidium sp. MPI-SDFR-AT-0119]|nr:hypothetical protein BKA61DRAFT_579227 [Leptodontidium sp. MPI-SDFR-AT-0119]